MTTHRIDFPTARATEFFATHRAGLDRLGELTRAGVQALLWFSAESVGPWMGAEASRIAATAPPRVEVAQSYTDVIQGRIGTIQRQTVEPTKESQ